MTKRPHTSLPHPRLLQRLKLVVLLVRQRNLRRGQHLRLGLLLRSQIDGHLRRRERRRLHERQAALAANTPPLRSALQIRMAAGKGE